MDKEILKLAALLAHVANVLNETTEGMVVYEHVLAAQKAISEFISDYQEKP